MALQNIRSNTSHKRPTASGLSDGQIAINTNAGSPGLFFKDAGGALIKVGPVHIGTSAPNSVPAGSTGNAIGEQWLDTSNSGYVFKIWDGTAWRSETGEFVDVAGDTMTGNLTISGADLIMSNGEIVAETGSAATPSITFTGDLDTGFYKPAANELAISTGGTGRVFIDDNGNVGIGTSSPGGKLDVFDGTSVDAYFGKNTDSVYIKQSGAVTGIQFGSNRAGLTTGNRILQHDRSSGLFQYLAGNNGSETAVLTINSSGNVGIGTSNPATVLHVAATAPRIRIEDSDATGTPYSEIRGDSGNLFYNANQNAALGGDHIWSSGGASNELMRIDSSGKVGIGTSSPDALLKLQAGDSDNPATSFAVRQNNGADTSQTTFSIEVSPTDGVSRLISSATSAAKLAFYTQGNEAMRIDSNGNVGIGTNNPQHVLDVLSQNSNTNETVAAFGNQTIQGGLEVITNGNLDWGFNAKNSRNLVFETNQTERMRIDSSGNVGIGTSSPSALLEVNGSFSKGSGSFKIDHPLPALTETHHLVHSFVEAPDASNLYAGMIQLSNGVAVVNIDIAHRMTEGTFEALNNPQSWSSSNESGYAPVKSSLSGNLLTIECQDQTSSDTVYYEVRGIRKDQHMIETEWTDESGRVITEPLKQGLADAGL